MILYHGSNTDFEAQVINMPTLIERLNYVRSTIQYCFCTQRAIETLKRV